MASIRKKGAGYEAMIHRRGVRRSKTFRIKAQAASWAAEVEKEIEAGRIGGVRDCTFCELLKEYARRVSPTKRGVRWETLRMEAFCRDAIGSIKLADLRPADFAEFRDRRLQTVTAGTVLREFNLINNAIAVAINEWGWLYENPLKPVKRPKQPLSRDRRPTEDEIERLLYTLGYDHDRQPHTISARVGAAMLFSIETAMRAGEIAGLTWGDVDFDKRIAFLPLTKNGYSRKVPLSIEAVRLINQMGRDNEKIFDLNTAQIDGQFRKAKRAALIEDLHFHDFRAEATTRLAAKVDILTLARITGHRDLKMLQVYYRESMEDVAKRI